MLNYIELFLENLLSLLRKAKLAVTLICAPFQKTVRFLEGHGSHLASR
jgi:hypothetical protein